MASQEVTNRQSLIAEDIGGVLSRTQALWPDLKGATVFITGVTGFFGIWLLETLLAANREFALGCRVIALTRDLGRFTTKTQHLAHDKAVVWLTGDVRAFAFPAGPVTHVIHAATESTTNLNSSDPQAMFDVCVEGTRRVLALASERNAHRLLFTSSGAVYGLQPPELSHVPEHFRGGPDPLDCKNAYAEGKRAAEFLCALAAADGRLSHAAIARCFTFVGPHLPLDVHFAIGNFIRDAINGGPIRVNGDGTPFRSYLYAADLAEWLVTILLRGISGKAYNVGSEEAVSIHTLAERVADITERVWPTRPHCDVAVSLCPQPGVRPSRYVPCCALAREELGLRVSTSLDAAIQRTFLWYISHS